jgi:hypothetical protein
MIMDRRYTMKAISDLIKFFSGIFKLAGMTAGNLIYYFVRIFLRILLDMIILPLSLMFRAAK